MADGDSALQGALSCLAVGRETTSGTYNTCTAGLDFLSNSLRTKQEIKKLEEVNKNRTASQQIQLGKVVEGEVEFYFYTEQTACAYMLQNALGGSITSATATGETAGGLAFTHTFDLGNYDNSFSSICINLRKGDSGTGKIFEYVGMKTNELAITAEIDDALKMNCALVGIDSTQTTNDVASAIAVNAGEPLSFVNGRISVENSFGSLTSSSFWHVQSIEYTLSNNHKSGSEVRRIGSDTPQVITPGFVGEQLTVNMRFDTTTAYDALIANTKLYGEFEFLGTTLGTSVIPRGLKLQFQHLRVMDSNDPEIGGPDEVLQGTIILEVLRDPSTSGYSVQAELTNAITSY